MKLFLLISFVFNGVALAYLYIKPKLQKQPDEWSVVWNNARSELFSSFPIDTGDIVFIGTSITEQLPLQEVFKGFPVKNRGIGSNLTHQMLDRLKDVLKGKPSLVVIEGGINDIAKNVPVEQIVRNISEMTSQARKSGAEVIVVSPTPTCGDQDPLMPGLQRLKTALKDICNKEGVVFVDVFSPLLSNGKLDSSYTWDGIHLNSKGYKIYVSNISPLIINYKETVGLDVYSKKN